MYASTPQFQPFCLRPHSGLRFAGFLVKEMPLAPPSPCRAVTTATARSPAVDPADLSSLQSTASHRVWVAVGCGAVMYSLHHAITLAVAEREFLFPLAAAFAGYSFADLGSGVYHWFVDNYGDASTPLFGSQIEAFQGHHKYPHTITRRAPCNNLHALARAVAIAVALIEPATQLAGAAAGVHAFISSSALFIMFSQQFHAWAHEKRGRLPAIVDALQSAGVLVSRAAHAAHHRAPYNNNYCIVSGMWNGVLDESKAFEVMEMVVFFKLGVRPRSWSEPTAAWAELPHDGGDGETEAA